MGPEFKAWPKTPRLFRDMVITEKIDGTNAAVIIEPSDMGADDDGWCANTVGPDGEWYKVGAQSRNRVIEPGRDNAGFATWVDANAESLIADLGAGYHYGEWWGSGIQRGYGLTGGEKRFSLFNVNRYARPEGTSFVTPDVDIVPILARFTFSTGVVQEVLLDLGKTGSRAAPGFMRPEGVVVFHAAAGIVFKATIDGDEEPKGVRR